ncbi:MAG: endolytic transglycosylase MltG [Acidimicrobiia bacterium]
MSRFKIQKKNEKVRARKRNIATLLAILFLLMPFILGSFWLWYQISAFGDPGKAIAIEIPKGTSTTGIGKVLEKNNVVRSGTAFAIYSKLKSRGPFQAGQYKIKTNISAAQAASVLEKGPIINYDNFTIIPGQRLQDIKSYVGKLPNMTADKFQEILDSNKYRSKFQPDGVNNLEGFLLPETYQISTTENEEDIIRRSLQEFDARAQNNGLDGEVNGLNPYQIITLASLIEKEAQRDDERAKIASVIYNRLSINMPLQIDASVLYGLGRGSGSLTTKDLKTNTPFNTYTNKGLPPSPISMISMKSLGAALNPETTEYLYYVLIDKKTGKHAFSKTYQEHLANIEIAKQNGAL